MNHKYKVLIMRCQDYDTDKISRIITNGMTELGVKPSGKILLKPNTVLAHPTLFPHAFTRSEFLDSAISAVKARAENINEIAVGERSGITIPTRFSFKNAGYLKVIKKHKINVHYFDEVKHVPVLLKNPNNLRKQIFIPKPITECDFLINLPKFKAHPWSRLTLSLKNFIGIQDDRHRLVDHNSSLEFKIADLQDVIQPKFIAIDAIISGQETMLTPTPFQMGAIVMGVNSCAVDTVCCHMVNVNPYDVLHLRYSSERGFGPIDLNEIDVSGDFPLAEMQEKTRDYNFLMKRIDDYFNDKSNLTCTVGKFPEAHSPDYCWGGCPGALQEAVHIFRDFYPGVDQTMAKVRFVVGKSEDPLNLAKDERIIFAGNCTAWQGKIDGKEIKIEKNYKSHNEVDEKKTKTNDMILKIIQSLWNCLRNKSSRYIHAKGCPLSVAEIVNYLSFVGKIKNPNFDSRVLIPVNIAYLKMRFNRFINRFRH